MGNNLENKLVELIDKISEGVGIAAPKIYDVVMTQIYIDAFVSSVFVIVAICTLVVARDIICTNVENKKWNDETGICLVWLLWWAGFLTVFLLGYEAAQKIITVVVNPEYAAIMKFLPK